MSQPWIHSPRVDVPFILAPPLLATAVALLLPPGDVSPLGWLLLVVGIDVSHVYATLYRTYLDPEQRHRRSGLLFVVPLFAWLGGVLLYSAGSLHFWRVLAYLAVFHFVRQQYGFLRLYSHRDAQTPWERRIDAAAIYGATLYPLLVWHLTLPREIKWFVDGDFVALPGRALVPLAGALYLAVLLLYGVKEIRALRRGRPFNLPRNLVLAGTALSWYAGIVLLGGDLAFTLTNVVAHGVPYLALVWIYGGRERPGPLFSLKGVPFFLSLLLILAYVEEGFWDAWLWREHGQWFPWAGALPPIREGDVLAWLVPLLALPQATHYILDGFIWRKDVIARPKAEAIAGLGQPITAIASSPSAPRNDVSSPDPAGTSPKDRSAPFGS